MAKYIELKALRQKFFDIVGQMDSDALHIDAIIDTIDDIPSFGWISVNDALPEKTGDYLVWVQWPCYAFPTIFIVNYDEDCEAFGEWREQFDPFTLGSLGNDFESIDVMFWMPLPEPPEVQE